MSALAQLFGERIDRARRERHWSIRELADAAGVNQSTVSKMTRGTGEPVLGNALAVAAALGVSLDDLKTPSPCACPCHAGGTCSECQRSGS